MCSCREGAVLVKAFVLDPKVMAQVKSTASAAVNATRTTNISLAILPYPKNPQEPFAPPPKLLPFPPFRLQSRPFSRFLNHLILLPISVQQCNSHSRPDLTRGRLTRRKSKLCTAMRALTSSRLVIVPLVQTHQAEYLVAAMDADQRFFFVVVQANWTVWTRSGVAVVVREEFNDWQQAVASVAHASRWEDPKPRRRNHGRVLR